MEEPKKVTIDISKYEGTYSGPELKKLVRELKKIVKKAEEDEKGKNG